MIVFRVRPTRNANKYVHTENRASYAPIATETKAMTKRLNHDRLANDIDTAYDALVRIGRGLGKLDPVFGTLDRALIDTFTGLQELRAHLDKRAVDGGARSPFITRDQPPSTTTRIAVAAAVAEQRGVEHAGYLKAQRRHAANGERGWATRAGK